MSNPFELVTASKLSATEAVELWCDDKRIDRVKGRENCFVNGHRGTGKSMLFRILQHDCQRLLHPNSDFPFMAVYVPVRDTELITEEMELFQGDSQRSLISESHLSLVVTVEMLRLFRQYPELIPEHARAEFALTVKELYSRAFKFTAQTPTVLATTTHEALLSSVISALRDEQQRIVQYVGLRTYQQTSFDGPLFLFDGLLGALSDFVYERTQRPVYVLLDDGDDLPLSHTIVLNSWIARRHSSVVFKVSTMFGYKSYETRSRSAIQHPHDFFQYDIATRFLISDGPEDYVELLKNICIKRLAIANISFPEGRNPADEFFPEDAEQKKRLAKLGERIEADYAKKYTGRSIRDYVYRHLTSEYVKELNAQRNADGFSYSGFRTLALLSSGMVRDFIICAQRMYDRAARKTEASVGHIPSSIQSAVVREYADEVLQDILNHKQKRSREASVEDWIAIKNLVDGLGSLYKAKMLSDDSERRVFSFAFQDEAGQDLTRLLNWAVEDGYLMRGFISRKEGTGRRVLYVLTRRLGPAFNLDVSAYSGYLSLTAATIRRLTESGAIRERGEAIEQLALFEPTVLLGESPAYADGDSPEWVSVGPEEDGQ